MQMSDESYSFAQTRARLEEIVGQVRKKDTSLEKSLDLLEEGVRLANQCTELIDSADWEAAAGGIEDDGEITTAGDDAEPGTESDAQTTADGAIDEGEDSAADSDEVDPAAAEDAG
jgi:exodeoxyribonuclease VII small subunit